MLLHCVIPLAALVPGIRGHHSNGRAPTLYPPHFAIPLSEHLSIKNDSARSGDLHLYTHVKREKERGGKKEMGGGERWERDATSREAMESVVASVGSLSGPTTISSMYIYICICIPRYYLSKEESSTGQNKEENFYSFFLCLNESRTLPLHLWQLLALTHRNVRLSRDKGGGFVSGLGCVNPFVSRRISFHGVSTGLHRLSERKLERHYSRPVWLVNLLFSRLLRAFIDRKHRSVADSQAYDRDQRSGFTNAISSSLRANDLFRYFLSNSITQPEPLCNRDLLSSFLPSLFLFFSRRFPSHGSPRCGRRSSPWPAVRIRSTRALVIRRSMLHDWLT